MEIEMFFGLKNLSYYYDLQMSQFDWPSWNSLITLETQSTSVPRRRNNTSWCVEVCEDEYLLYLC